MNATATPFSGAGLASQIQVLIGRRHASQRTTLLPRAKNGRCALASSASLSAITELHMFTGLGIDERGIEGGVVKNVRYVEFIIILPHALSVSAHYVIAFDTKVAIK